MKTNYVAGIFALATSTATSAAEPATAFEKPSCCYSEDDLAKMACCSDSAEIASDDPADREMDAKKKR